MARQMKRQFDIIVGIFLLLVLISCSPEKRIARILKNHPNLIKSDTVYKTDTIIKKLRSIDTSFITKPIDTITITKDRIKLRIIRNYDKITVHDTVFPDTTLHKYAQVVNSVSVKQAQGFWQTVKQYLFVIGFLVFFFFLWYLFKK